LAQKAFLELMMDLQRERDLGFLWITHDLALAAQALIGSWCSTAAKRWRPGPPPGCWSIPVTPTRPGCWPPPGCKVPLIRAFSRPPRSARGKVVPSGLAALAPKPIASSRFPGGAGRAMGCGAAVRWNPCPGRETMGCKVPQAAGPDKGSSC
jgi:hypothetical protein